MKINKTFVCTGSLLLIFILLLFSCRKERNSPDENIKPDIIAFAGSDTTIQQPDDVTFLSGSYNGPNNLKSVEWKKLMGPACIIGNPNSLTTKVSGLQAGSYEFELTVVDTKNYFGKDKVIVTVSNVIMSANSVIFNYLNWISPWYNSLEIQSIHGFVPTGKPFKVFVQRGLTSTWTEAQPVSNNPSTKYEYFVETRVNGGGMYIQGSLYVFYYGTDISDRPSVKVEF